LNLANDRFETIVAQSSPAALAICRVARGLW
jgi:hypothetical protein